MTPSLRRWEEDTVEQKELQSPTQPLSSLTALPLILKRGSHKASRRHTLISFTKMIIIYNLLTTLVKVQILPDKKSHSESAYWGFREGEYKEAFHSLLSQAATLYCKVHPKTPVTCSLGRTLLICCSWTTSAYQVGNPFIALAYKPLISQFCEAEK